MIISTKNLSTLPPKYVLQQICKAISVLDAVLSQEWLYRYFSYNSKWAENEEFFGMRNGHGDELLVLFRKEGCAINGMAHEYYPKDKSILTKGLPTVFNDFIFGEPVHSTGSTFCIWTTNSKWQTGDIKDFGDGSEDLLWIFDGKPQTYIKWAVQYYEDDFLQTDTTSKIVADIYNGKTVTKDMVLNLVKSLENWEQLVADLNEIRYPYSF